MSFHDMLAEETADTTALAETLSLAVLVEPALLRRARIELHPELDAGAEADLWFSAYVASRGSDGIVFHREAAEGLRRRLERTRLTQAWHLVNAMHAAASPALRLEEEIAWLHAADAEAALPQIRELLRRAIASLVGGERGGLAHWAVQAVPRLPAPVRALEEVAMLQAAALTRLGGTLDQDQVPDWMAWILPRNEGNQQPIRVTLFPGVLEVQAVDTDEASAPSAIIMAPRLTPLQLDVQDVDRRQAIVLEDDRAGRVRVAPGPLEIHLSDGSVHELLPSTDLERIWRREIVDFTPLFHHYELELVPPLGELLDSSAEGGRHVVVRGQPGAGKTSLLTGLARNSYSRPVAWHFFSPKTHRWRDPDLAWASLSAQIERAYPALGHVTAAPYGRLRELLARIPAGPPLLLILDGLNDGAADPIDVSALFPDGIPNTVTLVTTADVHIPSTATHVVDLDSKANAAERSAASARRLGVDVSAIELLKGNLLALRLAGRDPVPFARRPAPWEEDPVAQAGSRAWATLSDDERTFLGIIAAAREPLTWWRIREAAGSPAPHQPMPDALGRWVVAGMTPDGEGTVVIAHEHLRSFIIHQRGEIKQMEDHRALLATVANWTPRDRGEFQKEYSLRYGLAHAQGAGDRKAIERLVTNLDFLEARVRLDPPRGFVYELLLLETSPDEAFPVRAIADRLAEGSAAIEQEPAAIRFFAHAALRLAGSRAEIAGRLPMPRLRHGVGAKPAKGVEHRGAVRGCVPFGADELVSWSSDGTVRVWNRHDGEPRQTIGGHTADILACAVSDQTIVSGGRDGAVRVWTRGDTESRLLYLHDGAVLGVHLAGSRVTSWDDRGVIASGDTSTHQVERRQAHQQAVTACLVNNEDVVSGSADRTIRIWSGAAKREVVLEGHLATITTLLRSQAHGLISAAEDGIIAKWNPGSAQMAAALRGHASAVLHCDTTVNPDWLISCSRDHTLRVWSLGQKREVMRLSGHRAAVLGFVRLPNTRLLSWSADRTLGLWSLDEGRMLGLLEGHDGPVISAHVINDGQVVSCSEDRQILRWQVGDWMWR